MKPVRVILLIIGSLVALVGFGLVGAGASLGWATVSYTHLRAHETKANLVCRLLL